MATLQPPRQSLRRFPLENVLLSGSRNSFKDPQLVLKTQLYHAPRMPYTGSRLRQRTSSILRHLLLIHVKDKADELEKLDLQLFAPQLDPSRTESRYAVECLPSECSLIFRYPKGVTRSICTLDIRFQRTADLSAVLDELQALRLRVQTIESGHGPSSHSIAHINASLVRPSSQPHLLHHGGPPLRLYIGHNDQNGQHTIEPPRGPTPQQSLGQPIGQNARHFPPQRPYSPGFQPLRPASTLGIPGNLGEGVYRIRRVGSAPGIRQGVRRSSRVMELRAPGLYTVSNHFDVPLERADVIEQAGGGFLFHASGPDLQSQDSITSETQGLATPSELSDPARTSQEKPLRSHSLSWATRTTPRETEHLPEPSQRRRSSLSQGSVALDSIPEVDMPSCSQLSDSAPMQTPSPSVFSKLSRGTVGAPKQGWLEYPGSAPSSSVAGPPSDEFLLQAFQIGQEGLYEAKRVWDMVGERCEKESESIDDPDKLWEVWAKHAMELDERLNKLASSVLQKGRMLSKNTTRRNGIFRR